MTHHLALCVFSLEVAIMVAGHFRASTVWLQTDATRLLTYLCASCGFWPCRMTTTGCPMPPRASITC